MKVKIAILLCMLVIGVARGEGDPLDEPHLTLVATNIVPLALKKFHRDQPKADEKHFDVYIRESDTSVEVEFVPEPSPPRESCGKSDCTVFLDAGGATIYGFGVIYVFDKRSKKITKTIRPR